MKKSHFIYTILIVGGAFIASCGNGSNTHSDSTTTTVDTSSTGSINPDTVPAADVPAGAPNPSEDSSRYGTGTQDSSKNRRP